MRTGMKARQRGSEKAWRGTKQAANAQVATSIIAAAATQRTAGMAGRHYRALYHKTLQRAHFLEHAGANTLRWRARP